MWQSLFSNLPKFDFMKLVHLFFEFKLCFECFVSFLVVDFCMANTYTSIALYDSQTFIESVGILKLKIELAMLKNANAQFNVVI